MIIVFPLAFFSFYVTINKTYQCFAWMALSREDIYEGRICFCG